MSDYLNWYKEQVKSFQVYKGKGTFRGFDNYSSRALAEEAGELNGQVAKLYRDDGGKLTEERFDKIKMELGDVFFQAVACCIDLGLDPRMILVHNVAKLEKRKAEGKIHGEGSKR